jgi:general secretion pathway protein K
MKRQSPPGKQRGIAALTAVLVVTLATVLAVNMLWQTSVELRRTELLLTQDQARQYSLGAEAYAAVLLAEDVRSDGGGGTDTRGELEAANQQARFPVDGGVIDAYVEDAAGRFNLNNLVNQSGRRARVAAEQFQRLLLVLPLERPLDAGTAANLTDAVVDWLDPDQAPELNGAEDDVYTGRQPAYRPANFWFTSTSELLAIAGFTPEIYAALEPNVAALPPRVDGVPHNININTATPAVLASLAPDVSIDSLEAVTGGEWAAPAEFFAVYPKPIEPEMQILLNVRSNWFLLTVSTSLGSARSTMYSLLERNGQTVKARLRTFDAS